ncbi:MAG: hypothetical protein RL077_1172, partial [Verrucomicrobiota bacterium]
MHIRPILLPEKISHPNVHGSGPLLSVQGLSKHFQQFSSGFIRRVHGITKAVDNISFNLAQGEALGLVGESGCGKTTTARCILRAFAPTAGTILFQMPDGRRVDLATLSQRALSPIRQHAQMIFQDPYSSLNPRMPVHDIIAEPLIIHRLANARERDERVAEIMARVGLTPDHRFRYPHAFSGGQRQRIGIARALIM